MKEIIKRNSTIIQNFSYITLLQIFLLITPLITYPYLTRILGLELYGWVITAHVVASYCSILVDFGFKSVSARHVSLHRNNKEKLSEIISSILTLRFVFWCISLIVFSSIIYFIPAYREHYLLFLFSFGITFNELLFPQFYFQGIERMKDIATINIFIRSLFVLMTFIVVKDTADYYYVPLLTSIGYFLGGIYALFIIFKKDCIKFKFQSRNTMMFYLKDASTIFLTDVVCTIKDKLNYLLIGATLNMSSVTIYDLGSKFTSIIVKPIGILSTVFFPRIAKNKNMYFVRKMSIYIFCATILIVVLMNIFLPVIVDFFIDEQVDLLSIRIFLLCPIFLGISSFIASNGIIAFGYNKYLLYSILITTSIYVVTLLVMLISGILNSIYSFVTLTLISYLSESIYRIWVMRKIQKIEI